MTHRVMTTNNTFSCSIIGIVFRIHYSSVLLDQYFLGLGQTAIWGRRYLELVCYCFGLRVLGLRGVIIRSTRKGHHVSILYSVTQQWPKPYFLAAAHIMTSWGTGDQIHTKNEAHSHSYTHTHFFSLSLSVFRCVSVSVQ